MSHPRTPPCWHRPTLPLCADDDWGLVCPSGCRLQSLISQSERESDARLQSVCESLKANEDRIQKSEMEATFVHDSQLKVLIRRNESERSFVSVARSLSTNLTALKNRFVDIRRHLNKISVDVRKLLDDVYQTEVDVDMKIRACGGSCRSVLPFGVNHSDYGALCADADSARNAGRMMSSGGVASVQQDTDDLGLTLLKLQDEETTVD